MVAGAFAVTFVGFGSAYTFSAFVESLQRDFGASRGSVSLVFSLAGFLYFGLGIVSGPLADRWGSRRLAVAGMVLTGLGLAIASMARSLAEVYAAYGLGVGLGVGCAYVPAVGAVQRWFVRRRGFASGLAVSGIGVGTLVMPPLAAFLIETAGMARCLPRPWLPRRRRGRRTGPADRERSARPRPGARRRSPASRRSAMPPAGASVREAIASRPFVALYAACLICSFGVFVPFVHLVPYALDHGVPQASAVLLLGVIGVGQHRRTLLSRRPGRPDGRSLPCWPCSWAWRSPWPIWAFSTGFWALAAFAFIYGVFYGGWVAVLPAVVMDYFGGRNVGGIIGVLYTSVAFGTLIGPSAAGFAFDLSHSYMLPIAASVAATHRRRHHGWGCQRQPRR